MALNLATIFLSKSKTIKKSLRALTEKLYEEGFTFKQTQAKAHKTQIEHILKNPFYYGVISYMGKIYEGKQKDNKPKHMIAKSKRKN